MKKVLKADLEKLLAQYYCDCMELLPIQDISNGSARVIISVNSVFICVISYNPFASEEDRKADMKNFASQLEAVTFGNLKVTRMECQKDGASCFTGMYIANAYEVIE